MTTPEPPRLTLEEARRRHDAAREELSRLCHGGRFRMSIPAQPDDSDVILGDALQALKALTEGHDPAAELVEAVEAYLAAEDHLDATMDDRYEVSDTRDAAEEVIRRKDELRRALSRVRGER